MDTRSANVGGIGSIPYGYYIETLWGRGRGREKEREGEREMERKRYRQIKRWREMESDKRRKR